MPLYDFECLDCKKKFEEFANYEKYDEVCCAFCGSKNKVKLMTTCAYQFANPVGTDRWNSDSHGHDYRYKFNLPNVANERSRAASRSHVGSNPYNDIKEELDFGEVK